MSCQLFVLFWVIVYMYHISGSSVQFNVFISSQREVSERPAWKDESWAPLETGCDWWTDVVEHQCQTPWNYLISDRRHLGSARICLQACRWSDSAASGTEWGHCQVLCFSRHSGLQEPTGIYRDSIKRLDGVTLVPWQSGRAVAWDVTVATTLADSYLPASSVNAAAAAEAAASRKEVKYSDLPASHSFQPIAVKTL